MPGPTSKAADCRRRPVRGIGRQVSQPRGAAEVQQHAAAIALPQQEPLGQGVERATASALGKVAGREGVQNVQAGQLGHPGGIAPAEVSGAVALGVGPESGVMHSGGQDAVGGQPGVGQQAADQGGFGFRQMRLRLGQQGGRTGRGVDGRTQQGGGLLGDFGRGDGGQLGAGMEPPADDAHGGRRHLAAARGDQHADEPAAVFAAPRRIEGENGRHGNANWSWALGLGSWGSEHRA